MLYIHDYRSYDSFLAQVPVIFPLMLASTVCEFVPADRGGGLIEYFKFLTYLKMISMDTGVWPVSPSLLKVQALI